jgi:hypothetical protein
MEAIQSMIFFGWKRRQKQPSEGNRNRFKEGRRTCWLAFSTLLTATGCMLLRRVSEKVESERECRSALTSASKRCEAAGQALRNKVKLQLPSTNA